jgi:hypothetical protein
MVYETENKNANAGNWSQTALVFPLRPPERHPATG